MKKIIILLFFLTLASPALAADSVSVNGSLITVTVPEFIPTSQTPSLSVHQQSSLTTTIYQIFLSLFNINQSNPILTITNPLGEVVLTQALAQPDATLSFSQVNYLAGKYLVAINGQPVSSFSWGVLAINSDRSVYHPGDTGRLSLAVLNDHGDMICNAPLVLTLTLPSGQTQSFSTPDGIHTSPACFTKDLTASPDYWLDYNFTETGTYRLILTSSTDSNSYQLQDHIEVSPNSSFYIKRNQNTRIYPGHVYPVSLEITSAADFSGTVTESVPENFIVSPLPSSLPFTQTVQNGRRLLSWQVSLKPNQPLTLGYRYDAPDISPQFYLLGPLVISDKQAVIFTESRAWQLASDAIAHEQTVTGIAASGVSLPTAVSTSTSLTAATNHLYLAAVSTKKNVGNTETAVSVTGLGLTWTMVKSQCSGRDNTRVEIWKALGTPSGDGIVTADLANSQIKEAVIAVSRYSGINTTTPVGNTVGLNTNGVDAACTGGTDSTQYSTSLTTTADGAVAYGVVNARQRSSTPMSGYTERADINSSSSGGDAAGAGVADQVITSASTVSIGGTISSAVTDYSFIALEILPDTGGPTPTPAPPGSFKFDGIKLDGLKID